MNADGTGIQRLTIGHLDLNASWHPDGTSILFNRLNSGGATEDRPAAIMQLRLGDRDPQLITDRVVGWFASAIWHPDGSVIAVASNAFGPTSEVCLMNPHDHSLSRVTTTADGVSGGHMDWSPDGKRILFSAFRDGQVDLYAIDSTGRNETRLTRAPDRIQSGGKWSPDGTRIVFHSTPMGEFDDVIGESELYVMDSEGGNIRQLTSSPESNAHPDW